MTAEMLPEEVEQPQDWLFTFMGDVPALADKYVVLHGTWLGARKQMFALYKHRWAFQYASAEDAGVERYGLTEHILPEDLLEKTRHD